MERTKGESLCLWCAPNLNTFSVVWHMKVCEVLSTGYALISIDQMYYKVHYPTQFWYVKMKYADNDADIFKYSQFAVKDGAVVMLPHVNYSAKTSLRKMDGEDVIQQGLRIFMIDAKEEVLQKW